MHCYPGAISRNKVRNGKRFRKMKKKLNHTNKTVSIINITRLHHSTGPIGQQCNRCSVVCVCVCCLTACLCVSHAKSATLTDMPFGAWIPVGPRYHVLVTDGDHII